MTWDRVRRIEQCAHICTGHKDPAKITHAKIALVERGLCACQSSALSQSAWTMMVHYWCTLCSGLCPLGCTHADESHAFRRTSAGVSRGWDARRGSPHVLAPPTPSSTYFYDVHRTHLGKRARTLFAKAGWPCPWLKPAELQILCELVAQFGNPGTLRW